MQEIRSGKWCMFQILTQDGPLCKKVCQVTTGLITLADKCFEEESMKVLQKALPPDMKAGSRLGRLSEVNFTRFSTTWQCKRGSPAR